MPGRGRAGAAGIRAGASTPGRGRARGAGPARGPAGQATLETVAMLPLLIAVALAIGHVLAAGVARELAGHAAEAGAIARLHGGDARAAARAALPDWSRDRVTVGVTGGRVRVRLEPSAVVPGVAELLAATAEADVGHAAGR